MHDVCEQTDRQTDRQTDTQRRVVNSDFHTPKEEEEEDEEEEGSSSLYVEDEDEDEDDGWRHRRTTTTRSREGTDGTPKPNVFVFEPVVAFKPVRHPGRERAGGDDDDADGAPVRCRDGRGEPTRDERW